MANRRLIHTTFGYAQVERRSPIRWHAPSSVPAMVLWKKRCGSASETGQVARSRLDAAGGNVGNLDDQWLVTPVTQAGPVQPSGGLSLPMLPGALPDLPVTGWRRLVPAALLTARANLDRRGLTVLTILGLVALLGIGVVVGIAVWRTDTADERPVAVPASSSRAAGEVVVAVTGRVHRPGLVRLPTGSRISDAVQAAGGVLEGTRLGTLNMARKLSDGELVVVGEAAAMPSPGGAVPTAGTTGTLVDLNAATAAQLDELPGVGPVLAQRIVDFRTSHGRFASVNDLRRVDGIGEARFVRLKSLVTA